MPKKLDSHLVREWIFAAERGDLKKLKRLLAAERRLLDVLGRGPYWTGNFRALHYAVARGHRQIVGWLLAQGASARPIAGDGDWASLHFAAVPPKREMVRLLIDNGAQIDIFVAAALGNVRAVRQMLRSDPKLVGRRGPDGATPLHFSGSPGVAKVLLAAGADPLARDTFHNQTPAEWTIENPSVVAVLANAGAPIDLPLACAMGDLHRVKALVRENPKAMDAKIAGKERLFCAEGEKPLGIAARYGRRNVFKFLLAKGALLTSVPSPLPGAVQKGDRAIVKQLLDGGADPNAFGPYGYAALHAATINGNVAMLRLLLSRGARLDLKDKEFHSTPLGWASYHKQVRAVTYLKQTGAT
jgi:ankyrin repeat protein